VVEDGKDSIKFQKALKECKVGRPKIPNRIKKQIALALKRGDSCISINRRITYKGKYGRIIHPSIATICQITHTKKHI
jgi:hypothetical protein